MAACPVVVMLAPPGFGKTTLAASLLHAWQGPRDWLALEHLPPEQRLAVLGTALANLADDQLLVIDAIDSLPEAPARAGQPLLPGAPRRGHLLLTARSARALPLDAWHARGVLSLFDRDAMAPSQAEWRRVFGADGGSAADWIGWWALRRVALAEPGASNAASVDWLRRTYLASLDPVEASVLGGLALCAAIPHETLASWLGIGLAPWGKALHALTRDGAPLRAGQVPAAFAADIAAAWQLHQPECAARCIAAALNHALDLRDAVGAARLARASAAPGANARVLEALGWAMLLGPARGQLGDMLASLSADEAASPAMRLLRAAWWVELRRAPVEAERLLCEAGLSGPYADTITARCKQMYEDPAGAARFAEAALAAMPAQAGAPAILAAFAAACAWFDLGWPQRASEALLEVVRAARRDGLIQLELDALHVLARANQEAADWRGLAVTLQQARERLADPALQGSTAAQSLARVALFDSHERLQPAAPMVAPPSDPDLYALPWLVARARRALLDGDVGHAQALGHTLTERLHGTYVSEKWRLEARYIRIWLAGLCGDTKALLAMAGAAKLPAPDAALHEWTHAVQCAAAALLANAAWPTPLLADLRAALASRGLHRLGATAALVAALSDREDCVARLGEYLHTAAQSQRTMDACWLAPRLLDPLARWLRHPAAVSDPAARELGLALFSRLQPPAAQTETVDMRKRPADLTEREWQVLQLIGGQYSNEQIATLLHVSLPTIKTHINRLYAKLGVASRAEAMQRARALAA
ncbi:LuxR C-terminal-related transcriptional regulator [Niveibacterium sp. 24ML]|uniref:LuxR C-terminal-related transcriptional regulator n=1 Tax=Niveibacterium sp. 24ML TaxID=2985512 RepID=UPI002271BBAC|nr:LuxR C-terminal-related transcriptional regulator [Niveibacterium sp. 24ML]MCX9157703.1 LuxR C-terminal-related transcriptional regulator [Niveibacterium sp. 24ML]